MIKKTAESFDNIRLRISIVFPIVFLLLFIGASLLVAGYLINKSVFHTVFEERERNKARNTHQAINSFVSQETTRISELADILKNDTDIVYGLFYYDQAGRSKKTQPLKQVMDQLYPKMNLSFFVMADTRGKVLYQTGNLKDAELESLAVIFEKTLPGEQAVTTISDNETASIVAMTPVQVFGRTRPSGFLVLGYRIDDDFAMKIAKETGSQAFIAISGKAIAGSYDISLTNAFDPQLALESQKQRKSFFQIDRKALRSYTYIPLTLVDKDFCLLIESDISVIQELLSKNLTKTVQWGLILLVCIALLGIGLAFLIIYPLNGLSQKALDTIHEYSGGSDLDFPMGGNEISTLVRANEIMLETIKNHLAERTQAEEAFNETSGFLHALIDAAPLAVSVDDTNGIVQVWNQAAARMFGWSASEIIGRPNPLLSVEKSQKLPELHNLVLKGEKFSHKEIRCKTRDGSDVVLAVSGAPLFDAHGNISSTMAIMADITDSKKSEEALHKSEERLQKSMKMEAVGKLAGSVAQDFNDLVSIITRHTELLLAQTDEQSPAREEAEKILKAVGQAATLTQQLLAFSRRQVLKPELLHLDELLENMRETLHYMVGEDIVFVTVAGPHLWPVLVDPTQIEKILANLCINALDAMPSSGGKLTVQTKNISLDDPFVERELIIPPGRYAALSVTDNGAGLSEETLPRVFEPFFTTSNRASLGLATVYEMVKQSCGYIHVSSASDEGTTYTVYFPAAEDI
ncbi:MAG: PAS domain S-box protein [Syntrophorhabdaceae bacterium]|nr:PAS domain S-box protein [Syntrophorhabdaceae bacterium]